jgi:DNA polymerase I
VTFAPQLRLVTNTDDVRDMLSWVANPHRKMLAVDVETEGLRPSVHRTRLVQIGDSEMGWAIPADDWFGAFREAVRVHGDRKWVGHNVAGFDMRMLAARKLTLPWYNVTDTMLAARLLDNTQRAGLKVLAARLVDAKAAGASDTLKRVYKAEGYNWADIPVDHPAYWHYSALDTCLTHALAERILPEVDAAGMSTLLDKEVLVALILSAAADRGLPVNKDACATAIDRVREDQAGVTAQLTEFGITEPSKPRQVAEALEASGVKLTERTATGLPSTAKDVLEKLAAKGVPVAAAVVEWRRLERLVQNYLTPLSGEYLDADGRVRYGVRSYGADTGRISVESPALHQLPKQDTTVRSCVQAPKGRAIVAVDFDQVEPRVMAHLIQEPAWIEAIHAGESFHAVNATAIYGPGYTKAQYQLAKNTGMALLYCGGVRKLAATAGVSEGEMKALKEQFFTQFPRARRFVQRVIAKGEEREYTDGQAWVKLPSGRRVATDSGYTYRLLACLGQGTGADILKDSLVRQHYAGLTDHLLITVHDECVYECDADQAEDLAAEAIKHMENHDDFRVPITASASAGPSWGEQTELEAA